MKYIDADKLRAEIDAFYTKYKAKFHQNGDSYHLGIIDGLDMAERILDTLEEPVSDDLEEAAEKYADLNCHNHVENETDWSGLLYAFKAGAEWMKRKMMDDSYEEEVQEVYRDDDGIHCCVSVGTDYKPGTIVYVITIPKEEEQ